MRLGTRRVRPADPGPARPDRTGLPRLARGGDAVALAVLRADLAHSTTTLLAGLLHCADDERAVVAAARAGTGVPRTLEDVVLALLQDDARTPGAVAELLDVTTGVVEQVRSQALTRGGRPVVRIVCPGWVLAVRADRLVGAEQDAARAHLATCRCCRDAAGAVPANGLRPPAAAAGAVAPGDGNALAT